MEGQDDRSPPSPHPRSASSSRPQQDSSPDTMMPGAKRLRHGDEDRASAHGCIASQVVSNIQGHGSARMHIGASNTYNIGPITQNMAQARSVEDKMDTLKFERMNARYLSVRPGLARSCEWLYGRVEYVNWRNPNMIEEHHGCLWIKGKPGSGKSTLMKTAVDKDISSHPSSATISHFFYRGGGDLEVSASKMYQSLLYQLLEQLPRLRSVLDILTTANLQQGEWPVELLESIFRTAVLQLRGNDAVTCYIDALDECDDREARNIIGFFEDLTDATVACGVRFRFCVSSRHYPLITMSKCLELVLDHQDGHAKDILKYVNSKLRLTSPTQKRQLIKKICEKASGVFLWVKFVVEELNTESDNGNSHELQNCLDGIPSELPAIFERIVRKDARRDPAFVPTLQWVLFSKLPLKREELYSAVRTRLVDSGTRFEASNIDMERFILRSSKGFVELVRGRQRTFQFIHETVRDYFASTGLAALDPTFDEKNMNGQSHHQLMQCCQEYLCRVILIETSLPLRLPKARSEQAETIRIKLLEQHPFLRYALSGIIYHADVAHSHKVPQNEFIETFPFDTWTILKDALEIFQIRRYDGRLGRRWVLAEQGASFLLEIDLQTKPFRQSEGRKDQSMLGVAIEHKHARTVEVLLRYGATADSIGKGDMSCLYLAVKQGVLEIVKSLLASGASADREILVFAVDKGNLNILQALVARVLTEDSKEQTYGELLCKASGDGALEISKWLLEQGAEVDHIFKQKTALQEACYKGRTEVVELLLKYDADVNVEAEVYGDALCAASEKGHVTIVEILLAHGAKVDAADRELRTALYAASAGGHKDVVRILLEAGADVNYRGGQHGSALQATVDSAFRSEIFQMLLHAGAHVNLQGGKYGNALQRACAMSCYHRACRDHSYLAYGSHDPCRSSIVRLLLKEGAQTNAKGGHYGNALQAACACSCKHVVRLLLDKGADPIAEGGFHGTVEKAVESRRKQSAAIAHDIAKMVSAARTKRLEILERYRSAALARRSVTMVLLQESEANRKRKREIEAQGTIRQSANIVDVKDGQDIPLKTLPGESTQVEAPAEPLRSLQTRKQISTSTSTSPSAQAKGKIGDALEDVQNSESNHELQASVRAVAARIVAQRSASTKPTLQPTYSKVMERTMTSLFGSASPGPRSNELMPEISEVAGVTPDHNEIPTSSTRRQERTQVSDAIVIDLVSSSDEE